MPACNWRGKWPTCSAAVLASAGARGHALPPLQVPNAVFSILPSAPYAVTRRGAAALAEGLAITRGDAGIKVSCLCPQGVGTPMLLGGLDQTAGAVVAAGGELLEPAQVADAVVAGLAAERFLILPHPEVATYLEHKATDPDRWLKGMRKLQARVIASLSGPQPH